MDKPLLKEVERNELPEVERIYLESFPLQERMDFDHMISDPEEGKKQILGIYTSEGNLVGFFALYHLDNLVYLMYFAVDSSQRGHGIGTVALHELYEFLPAEKSIVIDIERVYPDTLANDVKARRKGFYVREGFASSGIFSCFFDVNFEIMVHGPAVSADDILRLFRAVWKYTGADIYLDGDIMRTGVAS